MIITCKKCYAKFNLDENLLKQTGSKVRCSKCQNIFLAYPPVEMEIPVEPDKEMVGSETVDSDVETESVEQVEISEEPEAVLEIDEEDFDLFDIEKMVDTKEEPKLEAEAEEEPEELLGLELDTEPVAEETLEEPEAVLEIEEEELDLPDTEKMLDIEEELEPETGVKEEPEELELELDAEPVAEETPEEPELEFELEAIDKEELHEDEISAEEEITKEAKEESAETAALEPQTDQLEAEEVEELEEADVEIEKTPITAEKETKPAEKKRISTPVLIVLIIALLTGGAYGTYVVLKSMNIKIPFISDLTKPVVQDVGNLKINTFDIADKFIDNSMIGKLFIISGKVKNEYSEARSFIRVTGKLYAKGKILSKSATIYCGNVLSDQDLSNMDMNSINKKLANRLGDNKSNVNAKPGKLLPFMIVFPNIPDTIEEYTVEVAGSSPA